MSLKKFLLPLICINILVGSAWIFTILQLADTEYFAPAFIAIFVIFAACVLGFLYYFFNETFDTSKRRIPLMYQKPYREGQNIGLDNTPLKAISQNPSFLFVKKENYEEFFFSEHVLS